MRETVKTGYRPDIDGLRAVAVLLVVFYHGGVSVLSGGFVGVDVFFVISGFLITGLLLRAKGTLRSRLVEFYARRARRILPALALVCLGTLALGWVFLLPQGEQQLLGQSSIAATLFVANMYFWQQTRDYFAGPSELQPLLHLWSLGVEEQFYLVWPLMLAVLARRDGRRNMITAGILVAVVASLAFAVWCTTHAPSFGFFGMPSRVYELGTGALVYQYLGGSSPRRVPSPLAASTVGLFAIIAAAVAFDRHTPFPGFAALAPVLGTSLLLVAGADPRPNAVTAMLQWPPLRYVGRVSYSFYLWHWPLLSIGRAVALGQHDPVRDASLVGLAFVLASISTLVIEEPIRTGALRFVRTPARSLIVGAAAMASVIIVAGGLWAHARATYRYELRPASVECTLPRPFDDLGPCLLAPGDQGNLVLVGDSHANHWSPPITQWARERGVRAIERTRGGCPAILAALSRAWDSDHPRFPLPPGCAEFGRRTLAEIRSFAAGSLPTLIVISFRWPLLSDHGGSETRMLEKGLDVVLDTLDAYRVRTLIVGPTPEFRYEAPSCVARRNERDCRVQRRLVDDSLSSIQTALHALATRHPNVELWNPVPTYCDAEWCYSSRNGVLLLSDAHHLSRSGSLAALEQITVYLDRLMPRSP